MSHPIKSYAYGSYASSDFDKRVMTDEQFDTLRKIILATVVPIRAGKNVQVPESLVKHLETATVGSLLTIKGKSYDVRGLSALLDFQGMAYAITNGKDLEDNYFPAMGRYYGYPECCIEAFVADYNDRSRLTSRTKRSKEGTPHITCDHCHDSKTVEQLYAGMTTRRHCTLHPDAERSPLDRVLIEVEILTLLYQGKLLEPFQEALVPDNVTASTNLSKRWEEANQPS